MKHLKYLSFLWLVLIAQAVSYAAPNPTVRGRIAEYFSHYYTGYPEPNRVENVVINDSAQTLYIYASEGFAMQPFTEERVKLVYQSIRDLLPEPYSSYQITIYAKNHPIEELVIGGAVGSPLKRTWGDIRHDGPMWVIPLDRSFAPTAGLAKRHISLWASHGSYYSITEKRWKWQRPRLFCTAEDLFSQTFVIPYLIPMLENAGAYVFTPRERDWQKHEALVDNDLPDKQGSYQEQNGQYAWQDAGMGFAHLQDFYVDHENPFQHGTARAVDTQSHHQQRSSAIWTPAIPADGRYAVYVSYVTLPSSVTDATYTVRHRGISSRFKVNQQMGGGTWVYLGTFDFEAGQSADNCVVLTNESRERGHITADAVRFGGGMGNISRGDSIRHRISGMPRFLEAARYSAQWSGMPYSVYGNKMSENDYAEDINTRSYMTNYLARGSAYLPLDSTGTGLRVPIDLSLALHTDAGFSRDAQTHTGTLSVYTTDFDQGLLPSGVTRLSSRDLANLIQTQVEQDLRATYGTWKRRQMFDRNYSETREPRIPSAIIEMLSHQNFADLCKGHDPSFKFTFARAIYKGILRYEAAMHGQKNVVVQPLPVTAPTAMADAGKDRIHLAWMPQNDKLEPTAAPSGYIVYHREGDADFDNGTFTDKPHMIIESARRGVLHRFIITAVNAGGQSMASQEVCAYLSTTGKKNLLLVDGFSRLAGPFPVDNDSIQGFDMTTDPGVPMGVMPGYCGRQLCFDKRGMGREGYGGLGHSTAELEGMLIAGNTLDWSTRHAIDIVAATQGRYNISSTTQEAFSRMNFDLRPYQLMDIALGLQKYDGYSLTSTQSFSPALRTVMAGFVRQGGSLLVSGSFVASDMTTDADRLFTRSVLKYEFGGALPSDSIGAIAGLGTQFDIYRHFNEQSYTVPAVDCLAPMQPAFCSMVYANTGQSAAVAYQGTDYRCMTLGFPIESVNDREQRRLIWAGMLQFLLE